MAEQKKHNKSLRAEPSPTIKFIDLFAGLGGIRLGFEQALAERGMKGKCVFTSEIKPHALLALNENFKGEKIKETDITKVKSEKIKPFSVLLGGFPCQAFSNAGAQKGFADTRGTLFFDVQRIMESHLDEIDGFILENVEGLVTHDREDNKEKEGRTIKTIMNVLQNVLGFNAKYIVLNAADFGIPQSRKRVYIVGCKKKYGEIDLSFIPQKHVGVGSVLELGLPVIDNDFSHKLLAAFPASQLEGKALKDKRGGASNIHSWDFAYKGEVTAEEKELLDKIVCERRKRMWAPIIGIKWMDGMPLTTEQIATFYPHKNLQKMLDRLTKLKYLTLEHPKQRIEHKDSEGHVWYTREQDKSLPKGYNIVTGKLSFELSSILDKNKPSRTLVAMDMNTIGVVDGEGIRHLTLREGLRMFGYPDTYSLEMFESSDKAREWGYDLIGNSVCVPVIKAVAERLLDKILVKPCEK